MTGTLPPKPRSLPEQPPLPEQRALFYSGEDPLQSQDKRKALTFEHSLAEGFACTYNGPGQAAYYGKLIQQAYQVFDRLRAASFAIAPGGAEVKPPAMVETDDLCKILGGQAQDGGAVVSDGRLYLLRPSRAGRNALARAAGQRGQAPALDRNVAGASPPGRLGRLG